MKDDEKLGDFKEKAGVALTKFIAECKTAGIKFKNIRGKPKMIIDYIPA